MPTRCAFAAEKPPPLEEFTRRGVGFEGGNEMISKMRFFLEKVALFHPGESSGPNIRTHPTT